VRIKENIFIFFKMELCFLSSKQIKKNGGQAFSGTGFVQLHFNGIGQIIPSLLSEQRNQGPVKRGPHPDGDVEL
jgi:hypothetical protein